MKIAILGTRGIPASYSGFETAAEQLASRLTAARPRGRRLLPPARRRPAPDRAQGRAARPPADDPQQVPRHVQRTRCSARCTARAARSPTSRCSSSPATARCASSRAAPASRRSSTSTGSTPTARKWPALAKRYLRFAERNAPRWADTRDHRLARRRRHLRAALRPADRRRPLRRRGPRLRRAPRRSSASACEPRQYVLFVGRLEPENNPHVLVEAFARISGERARGMKLVVVGGAPYARRLHPQRACARATRASIFPGYVFGRGYWELQRHAYVFCAPTEVGGTHPVILEALAAGNCVLVNDHAAERRDGRRRGPDVLRHGGRAVADRAARAPVRRARRSSSTTATARASARGATRGTRSPTSTSSCSSAPCAQGGPGAPAGRARRRATRSRSPATR